MSTLMEDDIKRWTAKRKTALVLDIIQGKTTVAEASRAYDLTPLWRSKPGSRKASAAWRTRCSKPLEVKEQYERQGASGTAGGLRRSDAGVAREKSWPPAGQRGREMILAPSSRD